MIEVEVTKEGIVILKRQILGNRITVGRGETATLQIAEPTISRQHVEIMVLNGNFLVKDLGSTHGVTHEAKRISVAELGTSTELGLGPTIKIRLELRPDPIPSLANSIKVKPDAAPPPSGVDGLWNALHEFTVRKLTLYCLSAWVIFVAIENIVFGWQLTDWMTAALFPAGLIAASAGLACLLAVPGWLIRGTYHFKVFFVASILTAIPLAAAENILSPFLSTKFSLFAAATILLAKASGSFVGWFAFLSTVISSEKSQAVFRVALVLSILSVSNQFRTLRQQDENALAKQQFEWSNAGKAQIAAGSTISVHELTRELRTLMPGTANPLLEE